MKTNVEILHGLPFLANSATSGHLHDKCDSSNEAGILTAYWKNGNEMSNKHHANNVNVMLSQVACYRNKFSWQCSSSHIIFRFSKLSYPEEGHLSWSAFRSLTWASQACCQGLQPPDVSNVNACLRYRSPLKLRSIQRLFALPTTHMLRPRYRCWTSRVWINILCRRLALRSIDRQKKDTKNLFESGRRFSAWETAQYRVWCHTPTSTHKWYLPRWEIRCRTRTVHTWNEHAKHSIWRLARHAGIAMGRPPRVLPQPRVPNKRRLPLFSHRWVGCRWYWANEDLLARQVLAGLHLDAGGSSRHIMRQVRNGNDTSQ